MVAFTPVGDTVMSVRDFTLHGAKTVTVRSYVAPWTQATDSMIIDVPERAIFIYGLARSPGGHWLAAMWDLAGQNASVLTVHDRQGRAVAMRGTAWRVPLGTWIGTTLLRPVAARGQGGWSKLP